MFAIGMSFEIIPIERFSESSTLFLTHNNHFQFLSGLYTPGVYTNVTCYIKWIEEGLAEFKKMHVEENRRNNQGQGQQNDQRTGQGQQNGQRTGQTRPTGQAAGQNRPNSRGQATSSSQGQNRPSRPQGGASGSNGESSRPNAGLGQLGNRGQQQSQNQQRWDSLEELLNT